MDNDAVAFEDGWEDDEWSFDDNDDDDIVGEDDEEEEDNEGMNDDESSSSSDIRAAVTPDSNSCDTVPTTGTGSNVGIKERNDTNLITPASSMSVTGSSFVNDASTPSLDNRISPPVPPAPMSAPPPVVPAAPMSAKDEYHNEMQSYILSQLRNYSLEIISTTNSKAIQDTFNSKFASTFSDGSTALELTNYYVSRPNLKRYTFDKELDRMVYNVKIHDPSSFGWGDDGDDGDGDDDVMMLSNKQDILTHCDDDVLDEQDDLVWRASNQSLLADALAMLTSSDGIVRPQYFASGVAQHCEFMVDLVKKRVEVDCLLKVSIPMASNNNTNDNDNDDNKEEDSSVEICKVGLKVYYAPFGDNIDKDKNGPPVFRCNITNIHPPNSLRLDPERYYMKLRCVSKALASDWIEMSYTESSMPIHLQQQHNNHPNHRQQHHHHNTENQGGGVANTGLRDALLFNPTAIAASNFAKATADITNTGLANAWSQLDSATNVNSKLAFFTNMNLLPSAEELEEDHGVNHDNIFSATPEQTVHHHPPPPPPSITQNLFSGLTGSSSDTTTTTPVPPPPRPPPSITGGLLSGLSRIAKAAAQPESSNDAIIPSLYRKDDQPPPQPPQPSIPTLYRKQDEQPPQPSMPTLYRKDNELLQEAATPPPPPTLYRKDQEGHAANSTTVSNSIHHVTDTNNNNHTNQEEEEGGWSDDDDLIDIEEEEEVDNTNTLLQQRTQHQLEEEQQQQQEEEICFQDSHSTSTSSSHVSLVHVVPSSSSSSSLSRKQPNKNVDKDATTATTATDTGGGGGVDIIETRTRWRRPHVNSNGTTTTNGRRRYWFLS